MKLQLKVTINLALNKQQEVQYLRFDSVKDHGLEVHIPCQEVLVHRGGVQSLEEESSEGHVVGGVDQTKEPTHRGQHSGIDAVVYLQHHAELITDGLLAVVSLDVVNLAVEIEGQHVSLHHVHVHIGQRTHSLNLRRRDSLLIHNNTILTSLLPHSSCPDPPDSDRPRQRAPDRRDRPHGVCRRHDQS